MLIEQAQEYIRDPTRNHLMPLLHACISAENPDGLRAVQLLAEDMYSGETFNTEVKLSAAWCLVAWEQLGLQTLLEIPESTPNTKNYSIAFQILATLSARERLSTSWVAEETGALIRARVKNWDELHRAAGTLLRKLALSIASDEDAAMYAATPLMSLSFGRPAVARSLFLAMCSRWLAVGPNVLSEYRSLLRSASDNEPALQAFFEDHSLLLDATALDVWSKPDLHGAAEPDFLIRRIDGSYLVVEIETPGKGIVTKRNQITAYASQAIAQALRYRAFLVSRSAEASSTFTDFREPTCLVVIGLESELNAQQRSTLRLENENRSSLQIVGFDRLAERAEALANNVVEGQRGLERVRMI